ncbi:MAG TPA: STAS/SEC14 domain-containing protein [Alphaproteobacteria bacterium]|nr:STAS/SEC14 domain-containing protein [Alphaproteobacteria bacterium]
MSFTLSPNSTVQCVFLNCEGQMTPAEITTACRQTLASLAAIESKGVLADVTALQTIPETEQLFDLAKFIWSHFRQITRIAIVVRWDQSRVAKLLELLVRTVGVNLTVFVSRDHAMAWMLGNFQKAPCVSTKLKRNILANFGSFRRIGKGRT